MDPGVQTVAICVECPILADQLVSVLRLGGFVVRRVAVAALLASTAPFCGVLVLQAGAHARVARRIVRHIINHSTDCDFEVILIAPSSCWVKWYDLRPQVTLLSGWQIGSHPAIAHPVADDDPKCVQYVVAVARGISKDVASTRARLQLEISRSRRFLVEGIGANLVVRQGEVDSSPDAARKM